MTIEEALAAGTAALAALATPRLDAELLLMHAIGKRRAFFYGHPESDITATAYARYRRAIVRRQQGEPIAYLTGQSEFWSLPLRVTPACLIPRPETELLVERALAHIPAKTPRRVLDLGTGSGAIALAIASERPRCLVTATDTSPAALEIARANAVDLELTNVEFLAGDWFEPITCRRFDLVVSNPPYVAAGDPHLARDGVCFEPNQALVSGAEGMDALKRIARHASPFLRQHGWLLLEHGYEQRERVSRALRAAGLQNIHCFEDPAGNPRVIEGQVPNRTHA